MKQSYSVNETGDLFIWTWSTFRSGGKFISKHWGPCSSHITKYFSCIFSKKTGMILLCWHLCYKKIKWCTYFRNPRFDIALLDLGIKLGYSFWVWHRLQIFNPRRKIVSHHSCSHYQEIQTKQAHVVLRNTCWNFGTSSS